MDHHQIDNIIDQLSIDHLSIDFPFKIERYESLIKQLCPVAVNIFSKEASLLELQAPIMIAAGTTTPVILHFGKIINLPMKAINLNAKEFNLNFNEVTFSILNPSSQFLQMVDQIRHINRTNSIHSSLLLDLLGPRSRNVHSVDDIFVAEEVQFLEKHDLHIICCSPRQVGSNEKDFAEQRVVSISSSSYSASQASFIVMIVNANLKCVFRDLHQKSSPLWSYQISRAATEFKVAETSKPNFGSGSESESKPGINASEFDFDPTSLYKSEFRGVKRFLGARV